MKRYHTADNGYKYDRFIFWGLMLVVLGIMFSVFWQYNFNFKEQFYFNCRGPDPCKNPWASREMHATDFFGRNLKADCTEAWCNQELLLPGEYGTKPPIILTHFSTIVIALSVLALLLNHFIHNRGKRIGVKPALKEKTWKRIKDSFKKMED